MRRLLALLALLIHAAIAQDDVLRNAILSKTREQLEEICVKASIPCTPGDELETLRAKVYEYAQREKPGTVPKPWKAQAASSSSMMFNAMDSDKDGKLSQAEVKAMIKKVNLAAQASGEAPVDAAKFFAAMDKNLDGSVDSSEASQIEAYLTKLSHRQSNAKPQEGKTSDVKASTTADAVFEALDKDKDSMLSRDEMQPLIEKARDYNRAQGVQEDGDFFATLDADGDGVISKAEASSFFAAMFDGGLMDEAIPRKSVRNQERDEL
ncbi:hypothetical protein AB1Y20_007416 [Prymnesium parvum]|uniref:EF-hand domain-containing protein n=1 Tax=Prymnesium parvum TaxID=97485 RepID=A0AB34IX22_PRYPA